MVVALRLKIGARAKNVARLHVLFVIVCAAVAGCSGGGLLFGDGPHSMDATRLNSIVQSAVAAHTTCHPRSFTPSSRKNPEAIPPQFLPPAPWASCS